MQQRDSLSTDIGGYSMRARAVRHSPETIDFHDDDDPGFGALDAGERMCAPRNVHGESTFLPSLVFIALAFGAGWAALHYDPDLPQRLKAQIASLAPARAPAAPAPPEPLPAAPPPLPTVATAPEPVVHAVETPPAPHDAAKADAEITTGALAAAPADAAPPSDGPLPPPKVDPSDPYQKRAAAVGLHPDVSRVLLRRMTAADYRNAGEAIKTAIAKTADDGVLVWPRQRKPAEALFRVHFVRGAAPNCRRYVVTVTKDGWSTTAPPMERCDAQLGSR